MVIFGALRSFRMNFNGKYCELCFVFTEFVCNGILSFGFTLRLCKGDWLEFWPIE